VAEAKCNELLHWQGPRIADQNDRCVDRREAGIDTAGCDTGRNSQQGRRGTSDVEWPIHGASSDVQRMVEEPWRVRDNRNRIGADNFTRVREAAFRT